jgi:putative NADH-flavin reductase
VVGGAGSLFVAPGVQLVDTPGFPADYKQGALAAREALNLIRSESTLAWTFLSPPILLAPGERTGQYRLGVDVPLMNGDQPGGISVADLAVAIVVELETPRHVQQRFTVAS